MCRSFPGWRRNVSRRIGSHLDSFVILYVGGGVCFLVAIAPKGGVVAGYGVCLLPARRRVARLYSLAVLPEYRGQGVAEELLRRLLGAVKGQGFSVCSLEVRAGALKVQRLYERFGFSVWKYLQGYYEDGEDALRMRVNL